MSFNNWYQFKVDPMNNQYGNPSIATTWLSLSAHDNNTESASRGWMAYYNTDNTFQMFDNVSYDNQSMWFTIIENKISGLNITLDKALIGNASIVWEYYGQAGTINCPDEPVYYPLNLSVNTCGNLNVTGECSLEWAIPPIDMGHCMTNGVGLPHKYYFRGYHVRARIVNVSGVTQSPSIIINETKVRAYEILIPSGDTVTPKQLYDTSMANGWGVVSQVGNMSYYVESNLFVVGTLDISHGAVLQVGDINNAYLGANYEIKTFVGSTLQMGELNSAGIGIYGGTLIYGNYPPGTPYYYWYGSIFIYDSTFIRQGGGYSQFGFAGGSYLNFTDSHIESFNSDTMFFIWNRGYIKRTTINADTFYNYAPELNFESVLFGSGNILTDANTRWQLFNTISTNMDGYDMNAFDDNKVTSYGSNDAYFTDSNFLTAKMQMSITGASSVAGKDYRSLKITAVDSSTGLPLENVQVTVLDNRNISNLFSQDLRVRKKDSVYNYLYYGRIRTIDTNKYVLCRDETSTVDCDTFLEEGDVFIRKNAYFTVNNMTANTAYVTYNASMSIGSPILTQVDIYAQWMQQSLNTTSSGYLPTYGEGHDYVILNRMEYADGARVEHLYDFNPMTFRFEKDGYVTQEFQLNVTTAVGDSWDAPLSLFVQMVPGSGSSSGAGDLFFIYDEDKRIFYLP